MTAKQNPDRFPHVLQQLRDDREEAAAHAAAAQQLTAAGVRVIDEPGTLCGAPVQRLTGLRATPDTGPGTALSSTNTPTSWNHRHRLGSEW